ncbi:hypothetical protein PoB_001188400 [Plakobranchus ocellatus]|uniref:Uncharacterized protein n=1 Tax=Plakobranchus ocellatus TaxID=259542 RepID=A0AAV3YQP9_9GAST|nr:hypothetical protein PoB_001188400 [Plakobranchus ocellatus]
MVQDTGHCSDINKVTKDTRRCSTINKRELEEQKEEEKKKEEEEKEDEEEKKKKEEEVYEGDRGGRGVTATSPAVSAASPLVVE